MVVIPTTLFPRFLPRDLPSEHFTFQQESPGMTAPAATILVVDDEPRNCKLLEAMLRRDGHATVAVADGEAALAAIAQRAMDLILLDIKLPGIDGYQVARALKDDPRTSNIPIIMVTVLVDRDARMSALRAGVEELVTKPIDPSELLLRVRNLLRLKAYGDLLQNQGLNLEQQVQARTADLQRFSSAMDATADAIYLIDRASMRFVHVNDAACRMQDRTREALLASEPGNMLSIPLDELARTYDTIIASGAEAPPLEIQKRGPDGSETWMEVRRQAQLAGSRWMIVTLVRDVTERKRAENRIKRLNRVYAVLSGINTLIVRVSDREELFREACRIAVEHGRFQLAWIGVVDREQRKVVPVASAGAEQEFIATLGERFSLVENSPAGNSLTARAVRGRKAMISNDILKDATAIFVKEHFERGTRSLAILPLLIEEKAIGVLALYANEVDFFDDEELALLTELASDIAFAVDHIDKARKFARVTRVNAILSDINAAIGRIRDRQELFQEVCRIAVETGGLPLAWLCVVDETKLQLVPVASAGADGGLLESLRGGFSLQEGAPGRPGPNVMAVRERREIVVNDVAASTEIRNREALTGLGIKSIAVLPLLIADRVIGSFTFHSVENDFFDDAEMKLFHQIGGNLSFALEHIEKEEKVKQLTRTYAVLSGVNSAIVRSVERDALFKELCRIAVTDGGFISARVVELDSNGAARIAASNEVGLPLFQQIVDEYNGDPEGSQNLLALALRGGHAIISNDVASDIRMPNRVALTVDGSFAVALLPIIVGQRVAAMVVLRAREAGMFDETEMRLLTELTSNIALAIGHIDNQRKLDYLAYYDSLTGLANRSLFLERVAQHMRSAVDGGHKLALFFVDLERFRNINESLGRPAGDALLKLVSEWLVRNVGDQNMLARLGGDHFAIVLPKVKQEGDVPHMLDRKVRAFIAHPFRVNDTEIRLAAKIGAAVFPNDGTDADTLLRNAEAALKKAKARGDRILFYTQAMNQAVAGNLTLESQLRYALENEEFVLHFQPKVNLRTGKLASAEALIRWNDPRTGLVPPGRFIPILEETGLIHDVGRWAMRKAIEQSLRWRAAGLPAMRVAVNVSPLQMRSPGFIAEVRQAISIDAQAAAGLEIEITESVIMDDVRHSIDSLQAIRAMGIGIAIDDFGTGFSSLSYLAKLPVDTLKIDRSFVVDMTSGPDGMALVAMIINLAHSLKLTVVAEGVETEEQSRLLRLLHCDQMQGYLFSKPVPADEFEAKFLAEPALA